MGRFLLFIFLMSAFFFSSAQDEYKGDFQIGVQGGVNAAIGDYKVVGDTKIGYYSSLFLDKYFNGNKFGLGVDVRYINTRSDVKSIPFKNGTFEANYVGKPSFQDYLFTFGPSYKIDKEKVHLEMYVKGGVMMQTFPAYSLSTEYLSNQAQKTIDFDMKKTVNDASNKANSWAGLGGFRFSYLLSNSFSVFASIDYVQAFGDQFAGKSSIFMTEELVPNEKNPVTPESSIVNSSQNFTGYKLQKGAHHQSINGGLGVKYIFGKREPKAPVVLPEVVKPISRTKNLQVVVRDMQTKLFLEGVTVTVTGDQVEEISLSDANGQTIKVLALEPGNYTIMGEKSGIKTTIVSLTEADFKTNSSVIVKELFHDDPRFTLVGETFDCNLERNAPNISTLLTNTLTKKEISVVSNEQGKFEYQLETNSDYVLTANERERYSQTELITTKGLVRSQTLYVTLKLGVCYLIKDGVWVLKNILYDYNSSDLNLEATFILDNVARVMKENESLRIELSSHTDSRGNDKYNLKLSQKRANDAVDYLVAKGIPRSRLVAIGHGESKLINKCQNGVDCTEQEHQENRRTEVKILDYQR